MKKIFTFIQTHKTLILSIIFFGGLSINYLLGYITPTASVVKENGVKAQLNEVIASYQITPPPKRELTEQEYAELYKESVTSLIKDLKTLNNEAGDRVKAFTLSNWTTDEQKGPFLEAIADIDAEYKIMSAANPPAKFKDLNIDYVSALKDYRDGCVAYLDKMDKNDDHRDYVEAQVFIDRADKKMEEISKKYKN